MSVGFVCCLSMQEYLCLSVHPSPSFCYSLCVVVCVCVCALPSARLSVTLRNHNLFLKDHVRRPLLAAVKNYSDLSSLLTREEKEV